MKQLLISKTSADLFYISPNDLVKNNLAKGCINKFKRQPLENQIHFLFS
jgi:hypothetical protein